MEEKQQIRKVVRQLINNNNKEFNLYPEIQNDSKKNTVVKVLWFAFIAASSLICIQQIYGRIVYFTDEPIYVNVYNDLLDKGDLPMTTICSHYTPKIMIVHQKLNAKDGFLANINSGLHWKLINMTELISTARITWGDKFREAVVTSVTKVYGECVNIFNDKPLPLGDLSLNLRVTFKGKIGQSWFIVQAKGRKFMDFFRVQTESLSTLRIRYVTVEKLISLNRKQQPCIANIEDYDNCLAEYEQMFYAKRFKRCRFPFMRNESLPFCQFNNVPDTFFMSLAGDFNRLGKFLCQKPCTDINHKTYTDHSVVQRNEIQILLQSNTMRITQENFAYDFVSLLCDIGGNVSLYLGLSCLSFVDLIQNCYFYYVRIKLLKKSSKSKMFVKISRTFKTLLAHKSLNIVSKYHAQQIFVKSLIRILEFLAFCLCIFQTYSGVSYYFTYPTVLTVNLTNLDDDLYQLKIVSCVHPDKIHNKLEKYSKKYDVSIDEVELIDLLRDDPATAESLWLESESLTELLNAFKLIGLPYKLFPYETVFGNCTLHVPPVVLVTRKNYNCTYKVYVRVSALHFSLKSQMDFQCNHIYEATFRRQMLVKVNTPANPCTQNNVSLSCQQSCYNSKLTGKNLTCSLPFPTNLQLPPCNTWRDAKRTKDAFLDVHLGTNPSRDCGCISECNQAVYVTGLKQHYAVSGSNMVSFNREDHYWEFIIQRLSFPISKLFCDIGSNLGSLLGLSLLSIFQMASNTVRIIHKLKISKRKK